MSGLEVAAAVGAIVSGFSSGVALFQKFRSKRKKDKKKESQQRLEAAQKTQDSLVQAGPSVQQKYGEGFAHIGTPFAIGDDLGRIQLLSHLANLQQSIIELLSDALGGDSITLSLSRLQTSSETVRSGSVRTLIDQYQRLAVARPIPAPLQPVQSSPSPDPQHWAIQAPSDQRPRLIRSPPPPRVLSTPPPQVQWTPPPQVQQTSPPQVQRTYPAPPQAQGYPPAPPPTVPRSTPGLCPEAVRISSSDATVGLPYRCKGCKFGHTGYATLSTTWKRKIKISEDDVKVIWGYLTTKLIIQSHLQRKEKSYV
ncbi:hypothetical protein BCR34DRAFT_582419 [Clohesyomyces aquaticus]|uniref:Uncharacterized protein n=1 Tax=Clohesyomyces aquaticus TaxID=1231657 RepID=A0A1Y2AB60_9PLEO|nr:hypothetical protein BCR34DRAFT_582419 [Clohesyomyces aquaticus]